MVTTRIPLKKILKYNNKNHIPKEGIDDVDDKGLTKLHHASITDDHITVHSLLVQGASNSVKTPEGLTPMDVACLRGSYKSVWIFLDAGFRLSDAVIDEEVIKAVNKLISFMRWEKIRNKINTSIKNKFVTGFNNISEELIEEAVNDTLKICQGLPTQKPEEQINKCKETLFIKLNIKSSCRIYAYDFEPAVRSFVRACGSFSYRGQAETVQECRDIQQLFSTIKNSCKS